MKTPLPLMCGLSGCLNAPASFVLTIAEQNKTETQRGRYTNQQSISLDDTKE
jgi:hypothetical protein